LEVWIPDLDLALIYHSQRMLVEVRDAITIQKPGYLLLAPAFEPPQVLALPVNGRIHAERKVREI
jgi:hypothetical protein